MNFGFSVLVIYNYNQLGDYYQCIMKELPNPY